MSIYIRRKLSKIATSPAVVMTAIGLSYFMVILDVQIVNVALPTIQREFGATVAGLQWIVDGYALVFAALLLTAGSLGDQLGARGVSLVGLATFTLASMLCGLAPTLWMLQLMRAVQGIGAAVLVPTSLALLSHAFPDASARARAVGLWASMGGLGGVMGPVIGGLLAGTLGWRSIFLVNVPVGALAFVLTRRCVQAAPRLPGQGIDVPGQIAGALTLALLTFACIEGNPLGWRSPLIVIALLGCVLFLALFIRRERRVARPMLPLHLFANRSFSAANAVGAVLNFGYYGQIFLLSLYFQQLRGYSPALAGLALLPETGMVAATAVVSGRLSGRAGPRLPMLIGLGVGAAGFFGLLAVAGGATSYAALCVLLLLVGGGTALTLPATTVAVIEAVPRNRAGVASAVLNAGRQVGGVLGVAILGSLVSRQSQFLPGMRIALGLAGGVYLVGLLATLWGIRRGPGPGPANDPAADASGITSVHVIKIAET